MSHGIDRYPGKKKLDLRAEEKRAGERRLHEESACSTICGAPFRPDRSRARDADVERRRKLLGLPQENLLYFLEKTAPRLQPWQRELLRIVRTSRSIFIRRARPRS
jgi:stage V sporulation protein R